MRVAILGGGPSAAYAFQAASEEKCDIDVFATDLRMEVSGAFWLRWLPASMSDHSQQFPIHITSVGDSLGYVGKQWGDDTLASSFSYQYFMEFAFEPYFVLGSLWQNLHAIKARTFTSAEEIIRLAKSYDIVFKSFLLQEEITSNMCKGLVYIPVLLKKCQSEFNLVLYNGLRDDPVVRMSMLFGKLSVEYAFWYNSKEELSTFLDLHPTIPVELLTFPTNVFSIGRLATGNRKLLAHEVYTKVKEVIRNGQ